MIRATFTSKGNLLGNLLDYLASFQENVNATHADVEAEVEPTFLEELRYIPDTPTYPLQWTSDRQRKAFFATDGFGSGIPYQRTGALSEAWVVINDGNGKTVIVNRNPAALWVYGSLAKTNPGLHQQMMHVITGWPEGYPTVQYWMDYIAQETMRRIKDQFGEMGSASFNSRAYSRR